MIVGTTALTAALDFLTSAELAGSVLFTIPLVLCVARRSKWLLWVTAAVAVLLSAAAGYWGFRRAPLLNPWIAPANRGLLLVNLLTLATLAHQWINKGRQADLEAAQAEHHSKSLIARNEQLESELLKIKTVIKGTRKPLVLTIKQYQAFAAQLSDLHRTMVVAAMCSGMRVSEVLALRWDQLDFAAGVMHRVGNSRPTGSLLGGMNARRADLADALRADLRRFGDDQAGGSALRIVGCGDGVRDVALDRAAARHRRHHQAIVEFDIAQSIGQKQRLKRLLGLRRAVGNSGIHWHGGAPD